VAEFTDNEKTELLATLKGIENALNQFNVTLKSIIEPPVTLNHFRRGASVRIDDSHSPKHNKTI